MTLSYAQRLEDYYLHLAFAGQSEGFYVDIGAGEPMLDNVSYWFYLQGWSGLVVEPQRELLAQYEQARPRDKRDDRLVGRENGSASFYSFAELHGLSTTKIDAAEAARQFEPSFTHEMRETASLAQLVKDHAIGKVDFLKIDVEGAEHEVLEGADWTSFRPRIILAEVVSPGRMEDARPSWADIMDRHGYAFHFFDGLNRYYVAEEEKELIARLPREIARWDIVEHYWDVLERERAAAT